MRTGPGDEERAFRRAALLALAVELGILVAVGIFQGPWRHGGGAVTDTSDYIEAQVMEMPEEAHLVSQAAAAAAPETVISKVAGQGKKSKDAPKPDQDQNQAQAGPSLGATHGAVALYAPSPVIPAYLRDREIKASVVIEFFISASGQVTPRLLSSSGNEELDGVALDTVKKWQFKPAEQEHRPVDSKTRLRIVFEVS